MSDQYVRDILRKCVATICKEYRITNISSIGVNTLVDVSIMHMKKLITEIERLSTQGKRVRPLLTDIVDATIPPNHKRRREIHIHSVLLNNCIQKRSNIPTIPTIPHSPTSFFEEQQHQILLDIPRSPEKPSNPIVEEECLWGNANPDSLLFKSIQPKSNKVYFGE